VDGSENRPVEGPLHPDKDLMSGLLEGDPAVLRILLSRFFVPLRRYAQGILGGPSDAEEAAQEAFIRLWEKRDRWREDGSVQALLFTLTRNAAIDLLRRRRRESPLAESRLQTLPSPSPSPLDITREKELRSLAEEAVRNLPSRRQEVFRLVREGGLSYREVAETLGITPQTVANLMSLALADLRTSLKPLLDEGAGSLSKDGSRSPEEQASGSD
jgi:RNA polymerase sigma-70 factor (ECF subfamily)